MSYADNLAKDRDKYRTQRNKLANHLRLVLDSVPDDDIPLSAIKIWEQARDTLRKIADSEPTAEQLLGISSK